MTGTLDARARRLRAAIAALLVAADAPELRLMHRWLDSWMGLGLIVAGVERVGVRYSLSHIAEREWRAQFHGDLMLSPRGYGVGATPWRATQLAAWAVVGRDSSLASC